MKRQRFKTLRAALAWRRRHRRRKITGVTVTSRAPAPRYSKRQLVVRYAHWAIAHAAEIRYAQTRPMPLGKPHVLPALPFTTDCSGHATMAYRYAGAADPNGLSYSGQGYTGTLLSHMRHVSLRDLMPGDLVCYGVKSDPKGHHVAIVMDVGSRTAASVVTCSHGSESGPLEITVAHEAQYQPDGLAGVVYLQSITT